MHIVKLKCWFMHRSGKIPTPPAFCSTMWFWADTIGRIKISSVRSYKYRLFTAFKLEAGENNISNVLSLCLKNCSQLSIFPTDYGNQAGWGGRLMFDIEWHILNEELAHAYDCSYTSNLRGFFLILFFVTPKAPHLHRGGLKPTPGNYRVAFFYNGLKPLGGIRNVMLVLGMYAWDQYVRDEKGKKLLC